VPARLEVGSNVRIMDANLGLVTTLPNLGSE
jgi:hypothetical protein